jgi:hypothetical protein
MPPGFLEKMVTAMIAKDLRGVEPFSQSSFDGLSIHQGTSYVGRPIGSVGSKPCHNDFPESSEPKCSGQYTFLGPASLP